MGNIYSSNSLKHLTGKLADSIKKSDSELFGKTIIITQTAGMNAWLKTELAQLNRVFANFEFQNQDGLFAGIYKLLFKERLQNNLDTIKYMIYDCLDSTAFKERFGEVADYFEDSDLRRIQLSAKIADLFDQYQLYRPEMIENWEKDKLSTENSAEKWQQWLWKELDIESKAKTKEKIIAQLELQKDLIKKCYPEISLFGISIYTRFHLDFIKAVSNYTNVNFYLCLPTNETEFKNDLLVSYGSKAMELSKMFETMEFTGKENDNDTLLARIQNQILNNNTNLVWKEDDSVQINSSYTPVREVESVYNYLLDLFEKDGSLKPGDVLVLTTDINRYAPFIKAVFRNTALKIPFRVSGAANNSEDSMVAALEQILNFTEDDLSSEKVVSLLEHKRIKKRFRIEDTDYIRTVLRKANIRFGRENRVEDDTHYISWKYGLEKILLGYAMLTDEEYQVDDNITLYPFKDAEASQSYDLLRLKAFVETLEFVIDVQNESRALAEWKLFFLEEVLEKMVYHDDYDKTDRTEISSIYRTLSFIDALEIQEKMPFKVFLEELNSKLFTESQESKINTGNITVSSPIPVRGLPYKVICFLGLNNDIFPRKDNFMGFDLLGEEYIEGDRSKKETDKYLFLDTLLAAGEKLYLSYIGQSVKDNIEIPPSIVIDTLLDYLDSEEIVVKHPLHGFSSRYQKDDKRLFTYLYAEGSKTFESKKPEEEALTEVSVRSFVKFFEHPIEWYFNNILGIRYDEDEDTLPETELFELNHLQKWFIKNDLLKLQDGELESYIQKGIKEGKLPLKNLGKLTVDEVTEDISELKTRFHELTANHEEQNAVIDLKIENIRISGTIDGIYDRQYIAYAFSNRLKYKARANLNALILFAESRIVSADFIYLKKGSDSKKPPVLISETLPITNPDDAIKSITELLNYFKKGNLVPLIFSHDGLQNVLKSARVENIFEKEAEGDPFVKIPPDYYIKYLFERGCFTAFDVENFNRKNFDAGKYSEPEFDEIKAIAKLLNLNNN